MERLAKHIRSHIFGEYMKEKELQTPNGILLNENFLKIETVGAKNQHIFYKGVCFGQLVVHMGYRGVHIGYMGFLRGQLGIIWGS